MSRTITKIRLELIHTFNRVLDTFATREDVLFYKPSDEGWSIYEVLEHIFLANHFLLVIVNKQTERALAANRNLIDGKEFTLDKNILQRMEKTGSPIWVPQRFIEPSGDLPLLQLKMSLHDQLTESERLLQNGEVIDAIVTTNEPGKTDALHYLYFLVQHMQRHLGQIERVKQDFDQWQGRAHDSRITIVNHFA